MKFENIEEQEDYNPPEVGSPKRHSKKARKVTSTRAIFMSYLKIPTSTKDCIIIPSAPEGGFFERPRFDEAFL